jgi:hypothetical protein
LKTLHTFRGEGEGDCRNAEPGGKASVAADGF